MKKILSIILSLVLMCFCISPCIYAEEFVDESEADENLMEDVLYEEPVSDDSTVVDTDIIDIPIDVAGDAEITDVPELPAEEPEIIPEIKYEKEASVLKALGIMETEDYTQTVTRAEFVASVAALCGYSGETIAATVNFGDVPEGHEYMNAIAYAAGIKLVQGDGTNFRPDEPVTAEEAGIILLRALGHDKFSPYVTVDIVKAKQEGIYKGVTANGKQSLTFDIAAKLIHNAMNLEMILVKGTTSDGLGSALVLEKNGTTLLNYYRKIYMSEGRVTDNGLTTYSSVSTISDNLIRIGSTVYEKGNVDAKELLGHEVEAYYDEHNVLLHISDITDERSILYIPAEKLISATMGNVQYETENGRVRNQNFLTNANIVYNGKALKKGEFTKELINPKIGGLKLIKTADRDYDLVAVTSQFNCVVKAIHEDDGTYMFTDVDSPSKNISFDIDDIGTTVWISNKYGDTVECSDIVTYNVLSVAKSLDGELLDIKVSSDRSNGVIESIQNQNGTTIVIKGVPHKLTHDADTTGVKAGVFGWYYIDIYGNVACFRSYDMYEERYGYLLKAWVATDDNDMLFAKIFDESGHIITCSAEKRITADGATVKNSGFNAIVESFYSGTEFEPCMIRFKLDMDGNLVKLDTYETRESRDSLRKIEPPKSMENANSGLFAGKYRYMLSSKQFDGGLLINDNTKVFGIPVGPHVDDDYRILTMSYFTNTRYYDVEMYTTKGDSPVAEAMIVRYAPKYDPDNKNSKGYVIMPSVFPSMMDTGIITDSQLVLDENQEVVTSITLTKLKDAKSYTYTIKWDDLGPFNVGEVIRYFVLENKIVDAEVVFDCNTLTAGTPRPLYTGIDTFVVRNNGREMADNSATAAKTPMVNVAWGLAHLDVISIHDGVMTGVTSDASAFNGLDFSDLEPEQESLTRRFSLGTLPAGVWKYDRVAQTLVSSSIDNIVCYEETQGECTEVLALIQNAAVVGLLILE